MAIYKLTNGSHIIADAGFIATHFPDAVYVGEEANATQPRAETWEISKLAFINRVGEDFWLDVEDAAAAGNRDFRKMVLMFINASFINLKDERVISGISVAASGLVPASLQKTQAEVDAILNTPCQPGEEP